MSILYNRISALCKEKGISVSAMCKKAGVSTGSISELKSGRRKSITVETAKKIAQALNVPVGALFGGSKTVETLFLPEDPGDPRPRADPEVSSKDIMFALLDGDVDEITDEMFDEVKLFAKYIRDKKKEQAKRDD